MKNNVTVQFSKSLFKRCCLAIVLMCGLTSLSTAQTTYWWNDQVFYEVFVRSFKDNNGDGQGDLKGLISKLDYLNDGDSTTQTDLGVTALWLMPIQQSPSYHGYDATDYRTVEADYGTNQDFKDFIAAAHSRGIKVIIDYVMNHTSSQHPWFVESAASAVNNKRNWYLWSSTSHSGITAPWGGNPIWRPLNGNYFYGIFWEGMPDLNYRTPAVKTEMFDAAKFWLQDMGVDGFRLDAARYIIEDNDTLQDTPETIQFWKDFRTSYKSAKPESFAVGEAWAATSIAKDYAQNGALDYCFEFDLAGAIVNTAKLGNPSGLFTKVNEVIASYPFLQYGTFLTNHDQDRAMTQLGNSVPKAKLAAQLLMTLPGVPYVYYGEEIGMTGSGADENKRTPMQWNNGVQAGFSTGTPWRAVNGDYYTNNVQDQQNDTISLWSRYKQLIALRKNQAALRKGSYKSIASPTAAIFSFLRQFGNENIVVVSNPGSSTASNALLTLTQGGITPGNYVLVELQGGAQVPVVIDNNGGFTNLTVTSIPSRSTFIYKLLSASNISTSVTLNVNMNAMISSGAFNPATETVNIVNDFGVSVTALKDSDGDGIYSITVSSIAIGRKINYKYRINNTNDGREEPITKQLVVLEGKNTVMDVYQRTLTALRDADVLRSNVIVYPVPTNNELFIKFSEDFMGTINYQITDLVGREIVSGAFETTINARQQILSCEGMSSGVYVLNMSYNGNKQAYRIVVEK